MSFISHKSSRPAGDNICTDDKHTQELLESFTARHVFTDVAPNTMTNSWDESIQSAAETVMY